MFNPKENLDQQNQDDVGEESSSLIESSRNESTGISRDSTRNSGCEGGLTERLRNLFNNEEGDGDGDDLLLQQNDRESNVLQWLQALHLQVMGACRADERLKPLLKMNVSSGVAEDHLLAHLSQHFEVPEVGMLARCLCIPLVSIRVGRVAKQGSLLCPTGTKGNLNLTLLPSSGLRISFVGDDGHIERLATVSCDSETSVAIEPMHADNSGRSFVVKCPDAQVSYFWSSEKSKLFGYELLDKMKDLLSKKPSLPQLTGISQSRLDRFATYLRSHLGPTSRDDNKGTSSSAKPSRSRCSNGSLSPRLNSFKDCVRSGTREKLRRRGDIFSTTVAKVSDLPTEFPSLPRLPSTQISTFTPYYCWCPPCTSAVHCTVISSVESTALPPELPDILPDRVVRAPLPVTPLMCDPIVHIPVMNICSSGQGYLVSAGSAISTSISPMMQGSENLVEKNARETLRLLLASTSTDSKQSGSRGLYTGTRDVETIASSLAAMRLVSLPHAGVVDVTRGYGDRNFETQMDGNKDPDDTNDTRERLDAA